MRGAVRTACCSAIVVLALCSTTVPARSQSALGARGVPGVVIVDPDAAAASAPSRAMAGRLQRAGYATLTVTGDPLAAAAALERRPSVRSDDVAVVGYGGGCVDRPRDDRRALRPRRRATAVVNVRVGDRVTVPTHICCGFCPNCWHGFSGSCLTTNPGKWGAAYGYPGMGGYTGAQAERLRVPFGDANCVRLPGEPGDRWEHDFVLLADALPTAYHATELAHVRPGDVVAIYGAGAIGLLTAMCAFMRGASKVFVVDAVPARLDKAGELGAQPIDMREGDPVEQILDVLARERRGVAWRGEEANLGVTVAIDAIGFQARDRRDYAVENPDAVIADLARLIAPNGRLAIIGVFLDQDPHAPTESARRGEYLIPWGTLFRKGVSVGMGRDHDKRYDDVLRDAIVRGTLKPGRIVSHRLPLIDAADAFTKFDARSDGYIKVVLDPNASR